MTESITGIYYFLASTEKKIHEQYIIVLMCIKINEVTRTKLISASSDTLPYINDYNVIYTFLIIILPHI